MIGDQVIGDQVTDYRSPITDHRTPQRLPYLFEKLPQFEHFLYYLFAIFYMATRPVYSLATTANLKNIIGFPDIIRHFAAYGIFIRLVNKRVASYAS